MNPEFRNKNLFLFTLIIAVISQTTFSYAQSVTINCCGIEKTVPSFLEAKDTVFTNQILISSHVLKPIMQSPCPLEIRLYLIDADKAGIVFVIKCLNNTMSVERISTDLVYDTIALKGHYIKTLGSDHHKGAYILNYIDQLKLSHYPTWNSFIDDLIKNHFFDLTGDPDLTGLVLQKNPNTRIIRGDNARTLVEIKIGNHYRNILYRTAFDPSPENVKEYDYLQHCLSQIMSLTNP